MYLLTNEDVGYLFYSFKEAFKKQSEITREDPSEPYSIQKIRIVEPKEDKDTDNYFWHFPFFFFLYEQEKWEMLYEAKTDITEDIYTEKCSCSVEYLGDQKENIRVDIFLKKYHRKFAKALAWKKLELFLKKERKK